MPAATTNECPPRGSRTLWRVVRRPAVVVAVLYAVAVWWLYDPLSLFDHGRLPGCGCGDVVQQVWLLEWAKVGLAHHDLSFLTTRIDFPRGANLADSASFPLLAVLAAPLTAVVGPIATLGLLFRLGVWLTALSTFLTARRLGLSALAAALAGAVFAFSPSLTHQDSLHMFLVFLPLVPPIGALVYRQSVAAGGGWRRRGRWLGILASVQFLLDNEILIGLGLVFVVVAAIVAASRLARILVCGDRWRSGLLDPAAGMVKMLAVAAAISLPLIAYPAWVALAGPQHIFGSTQSTLSVGIAPATSVFPAYPGVMAWQIPLVRVRGVAIQQDAGFIGLVALVVIALAVWYLRRVRLARGAALTGVVAWILSLGPHLNGRAGGTGLSLPFGWLRSVPGVQDLIPSRLTIITDLCVAVLLALATQHVLQPWRGVAWRGSARPRRPLWFTARRGVAILGVTAAVVGLLPDSRIGLTGLAAGRAMTGRGLLPLSGVVLAVPYPDYQHDQAMLLQANDDLRFSLLGGYANRRLPGGAVTKSPYLNAPSPLRQFLLTALAPSEALRNRIGHELPGFLQRWHVRWVVASNAEPADRTLGALLDRRYGRPWRNGDLSYWQLNQPQPSSGLADQSAGSRTLRERGQPRVGRDHPSASLTWRYDSRNSPSGVRRCQVEPSRAVRGAGRESTAGSGGCRPRWPAPRGDSIRKL
jgi:hypothetical protein